MVTRAVSCAVRFWLEKLKAKLAIRIPYSVVLLVVGGILGLLAWQAQLDKEPDERWTVAVEMWTQMNPRLILFIFLPALIFEGAMSTDYYVFVHQFTGGIFLAFPAMILQVVLIALVGMYVFPYNWGLTESLLFGGMYVPALHSYRLSLVLHPRAPYVLRKHRACLHPE
jgi:NhaP-type Na+/H+ or K+/H+ antiporter